MFGGLFKSKEEKVISKIQDLCEVWKDDKTIKNVILLLIGNIKLHKKDYYDQKKLGKKEILPVKKHWVALNFQLVLGCVAKKDDINLYQKIRDTFKLDNPKSEVGSLIINNYAPIYSRINSDFAWAFLAEELLYHCYDIPKEIGINDSFNKYHLELNDFIMMQHLNYKKYFDTI